MPTNSALRKVRPLECLILDSIRVWMAVRRQSSQDGISYGAIKEHCTTASNRHTSSLKPFTVRLEWCAKFIVMTAIFRGEASDTAAVNRNSLQWTHMTKPNFRTNHCKWLEFNPSRQGPTAGMLGIYHWFIELNSSDFDSKFWLLLRHTREMSSVIVRHQLQRNSNSPHWRQQ